MSKLRMCEFSGCYGETAPNNSSCEAHKKYEVIYADPPWNFGNRMYSSNKNDHHREISRAYPVMKTADIARLNVKSITEDDAVCFMWTTDAHLPDALQVLSEWGFKYKTIAFIWNKKEKSGKQVCYMGQWTMKGSEIVIFGTKGKPSHLLKSRKVRQLVEATRERTIHSRKPEAVAERIEEMFGDVNKIELFARVKRPGWDVWGNELSNDVELLS